MKKLLCMLLTVAMVISTAMAAFAAEEAEAPIEKDTVEEIVVEEILEYSAEIGDYNVSLNAAAGVFPNGTTVNVNKASDEREAEISEMVKALLSEDEELVKTITFDFDFADAEGNKVEPDGIVDVRIDAVSGFESIESGDTSVAAFHLSDEGTLEQVDASNADGIVSFAAAEFSSYTIVVTNHNIPDSKKPTIKSVSLSRNVAYATGDIDNDNIVLNVKVSDDLAGISEATFEFYNKSADKTLRAYACDIKSGKISSTIDVYDAPAGEYVLSMVEIIEKAGNRILSYNADDMPSKLKGLSFTVQRPETGFAPTIKDVVFDKTNLIFTTDYPNGEVYATATASSSGEKINTMDITLRRKSGGTITDKSFFSIRNSWKTTDGPYKDYICFYPEDTGTWYIESITFYGVKGSIAVYSKSNNTLPEAIGNKKIVVKSSTGIDKTVPKITSVKFLNSQATIGKKTVKIPVEIVVSDKGNNVNYASFTMTDKKGRHYECRGLEQTSNTTFVGSVSLSKYAASATCTIDYAEVTDWEGNKTFYYKTIPTGYKSTSKVKYVKIKDSVLKNVKMKIKNDFSYNIKFDRNGGTSGRMSTIKKCKANKSYKLSKNRYKKKGYKFAGWNTKPNGSGKSYKNRASVKNLTKTKGTVTLYAQWKKKK